MQGDQVQILSSSECAYPSSPALGLGLTAAIALMIAQIIINVATGCVCCRKGPHQSNADWTLALTCFVVSWFTFVIAFLLLLTGAALNSQRTEENLYYGYNCYVVKPFIFGGAAVLSLSSVVLGIIYYVTLSSAKNRNNGWGAPVPPPGGIAMGEAQVPPQDPVFVHEDTYMRRQVAL
ncbi:hypothetical protein ACS0TY_010682 [Phlomoides rotata]